MRIAPMTRAVLALISLAPTLVLGRKLKVSLNQEPSRYFAACQDILTNYQYGDIPLPAEYYSVTESAIWRSSIIDCMHHYNATEDQIIQGWQYWLANVDSYADYPVTKPTLQDFLAGMSDSYTVFDPRLVVPMTILNSSMVPNEAAFNAGLRTEVEWTDQMNYHHAFGWSLYILLGTAILAQLIHRCFVLVIKRINLTISRSEIEPSDSKWTSAQTLFKKHLGVPALLGYRHAQPWGWFYLPTRLQSCLIFAYVLLNIVFMFVDFVAFDENMYWSDRSTPIVRYLSDRTGIMAFYNLPLLWCLAGRNDILIWLTGLPFSTMNIFHRWVATMATLQAIIHSAGYTWIERDYLASSFKEMYWNTGVGATVCMALLIPCSILPIRKYCYEVFLVVHIALALGALVLLFFHVTIMDGQYDSYLWVTSGVWVFDRLARFVRITILSYNVVQGDNAVATMPDANGMIRLSVRLSAPIRPAPGQHYFLYTPRSLTPWENHPFTVAFWKQDKKGVTLEFLIAAQKGATCRLRRRFQKGHTNMKVLLEGPYGHREPVDQYEHVLMVAGGSGITAILPYLQAFSTTPGRTRRINLVWIVKRAEYAMDVFSHELRHLDLGSITVSPSLFVTGSTDDEASRDSPDLTTLPTTGFNINAPTPSSSASMDSNGEKVESEKEKTSSGFDVNKVPVEVFRGRPQLNVSLDQAVKQMVGDERLAVLTCGPSSMVDDLRQVVVSAYGLGERGVRGSAVDYFEELFSW